jgi:hypothetical protein
LVWRVIREVIMRALFVVSVALVAASLLGCASGPPEVETSVAGEPAPVVEKQAPVVKRPDPVFEKPAPVVKKPEPPTVDVRLLTAPELRKYMAALDHLESTPPALRREIDKKIATMVDFQSGVEGFKAQTRLIEIGKPAVPLLLREASHLTFESIEHRSAGAMLDKVLREITNYKRITPLKLIIEKPAIYWRVFKYHLVWWKEHEHLAAGQDSPPGDQDKAPDREPALVTPETQPDPETPEAKQARLACRRACAKNLVQLSSILVADSVYGGYPKESGSGFLLRLYLKHERVRGNVSVFKCPGDTASSFEAGSEQHIALFKKLGPKLDTWADGITSYAGRNVRDFPIPWDSEENQPIACDADAHHRDGVNVMFYDGKIEFFTWKRLGIASAKEFKLGPDGPELLRPLCARLPD